MLITVHPISFVFHGKKEIDNGNCLSATKYPRFMPYRLFQIVYMSPICIATVFIDRTMESGYPLGKFENF